MRLLLKSFSQDVDFLNPNQETSYLVFLDEDSRETYRLPVPKETILELVQMVQGELTKPEELTGEPLVSEASVPYEEDGAEIFEEEGSELGEDAPDSEEEVPSL